MPVSAANEQNKTKLPEIKKEKKSRRICEAAKEETDLTDLIVSMQQKCATPLHTTEITKPQNSNQNIKHKPNASH